MTKEVLKLALEALEYHTAQTRPIHETNEAITAIKAALEAKVVQVSPLEFVEMVMEKEHLVGNPIFWAEWPNKDKT
jgi:hypothetical protein